MKSVGNIQESSSCGIITIMAALALLISLFSLASLLQQPTNDLSSLVSFQFDTYCPINSQQNFNAINLQLAKQGISPLDFDYLANDQVYVVNIQARPTDPNDIQSEAGLFYCGLARKWWQDSCQSARFTCSSPGPMFYFKVKQQATIIWLNWIESSCYDSSASSDHDCTVTKKPENWKKCTYFQPTDYQYNNLESQRVNRYSVPISPHIHGLEIRPVYDGNPLFWFTSHGQQGPAFQSLHVPDYFKFFTKEDRFEGQRAVKEDISQKIKVIKVNNDQAPGLLFYHDHAMKSTLYNVQNGLGGLWRSRPLPKGEYLKYIVFSKQGDSRQTFVSTNGLLDTYDSQIFERSATYRLRFLNAAFDNAYDTVTFSAYYTERVVEGEVIYQEIDPSDQQYPLDENKHVIPFTVIGTDTTMFHKAVHNVSYANFGPAERLDLLIRFDKVLPPNVNNVYLVCFDNNEGASVIKHHFKINHLPITYPTTLSNKTPQIQIAANNIQVDAQDIISQRTKNPADYHGLNVPFTNLSEISDKLIATQRHRPLFSLPRDGRFMIGAHFMFENGRTDQSTIGTVEDFYLINNLWEAHPMHIHLINHQVVKAFKLKQLPQNPECTLYFLDYFRLSGLPEFKGLTNVDLCSYLWSLSDEQVLSLFQRLKDYMPEDKLQASGHPKINGLNVMALSHGDPSYKVGNCDYDDSHKYICGGCFDEVLEHERRWKDTSMVHAYSVFVLRVRWASTTYDPLIKAYPYFNIPEEQLVEFPGYVYHCHILPHQDNEMMRSISLQYSGQFVRGVSEGKGNCLRKRWQQKMLCINEELGCKLVK